MDLEEFVAGTLTQIAKGIQRAQEESAGTGAWINPAGSRPAHKSDAPWIEFQPGTAAYMQNVEFDVAVTVTDEQSAGAKAGIKIFAAKLDGGGDVKYTNAAVSRVQFRVPVVWPASPRDALEEKRKAARASESRRVRGADWMQR